MIPSAPPWTRKLGGALWKACTTERAALLLVLVLAVATRFFRLGAESLWLDEAITFHRSAAPFADLVADAKASYHNPAYFLLVKGWMTFGDSEAMLRFPSACLGVLKVLAVYALGRIVGGRWVAFGAALVIIVNPSAVAFDQEARMYALYVFGASIAMCGVLFLVGHPEQAAIKLWRSSHDPRTQGTSPRAARMAWLAFVAGAVVSLYSHGTATLFLVACSCVALLFIAVRPLERRTFFSNWVIANLIVLAAFSPWLIQLFEQATVVGQKFWLPMPSNEAIIKAVRRVYLWGDVPWLWVLILALATAGSFALRKSPLSVLSLWMFALLGPVLLLVASLRQPIFMQRVFLWSAVPFAVLAGAGLVALKAEWKKALALGTFLALGGVVLEKTYYSVYGKKPRWRDALTFVSRHHDPKEKVFAISRRENRLLEYYFGRRSQPLDRFPYHEVRSDWSPAQDRLVAGVPGVWTIRARALETAASVTRTLEARGRRELSKKFGRSLLVEYFSLGGESRKFQKGTSPRKKRPSSQKQRGRRQPNSSR
jgi:4-amino-4-deoxy-L-arabinose transferase-like glycosyltransferase